MIEKMTLVCKLHEIQQSNRHVYFQHRPDGDERRQGVYMTREAWIEMNAPRVITITVEAGNQIPDEEDHQRLLLDKIPSRMPKTQFQMPPVAPTDPPVSP
jgi:hypothetical protein